MSPIDTCIKVVYDLGNGRKIRFSVASIWFIVRLIVLTNINMPRPAKFGLFRGHKQSVTFYVAETIGLSSTMHLTWTELSNVLWARRVADSVLLNWLSKIPWVSMRKTTTVPLSLDVKKKGSLHISIPTMSTSPPERQWKPSKASWSLPSHSLDPALDYSRRRKNSWSMSLVVFSCFEKHLSLLFSSFMGGKFCLKETD